MKTLFILTALGAAALTSLPAQEPAARDAGQSNFFQRFFGPNAAAGNQQDTRSAAMVPPRKRVATSPEETWPLFTRGHLPEGKVITESDAAKLATGTYTDQTIYLVGKYVVTAGAKLRAVLRGAEPEGPMRIVVEYPEAHPAPAEGATVTIEPAGGLLLQRVHRGADNTVTVFVREVTEP